MGDGKAYPVRRRRCQLQESLHSHAEGGAAPEQLDVAFVEAGSAAETRARLREGGLDAALIDITLPDGSGLDLVGEINDGGPGNRILTLVLTANLEPSVAGRAIEAGARGALSKVVSVPETVEAIKRPTKPGRSEA